MGGGDRERGRGKRAPEHGRDRHDASLDREDRERSTFARDALGGSGAGGYRQGGARDAARGDYAGGAGYGGIGYGGDGYEPHEDRGFAGRGPKGYRRSDERIQEEVCERLTRHPAIDASDIEVNVAGGEVTLTGQVDSRRTKRLVEDVVDRCGGVVDVANQLRIARQA